MRTRLHPIFVCVAITHALSASAQPATASAGVQITRAGSQPSAAGPDAFFTGRDRVDPIWPADANINAAGANVTSEAGARSAWHTHPAGQHLVVVSVASTVDGKNVNWMEKVSDAQYTSR